MDHPVAGLNDLQTLLSRIISLIVPTAFVALFIMFLWAGFKYLTSGGEPKGIQSARSTIIWALVGMLLLIIAWIVLKLIQAFTGTDVIQMDLCFTKGTC